MGLPHFLQFPFEQGQVLAVSRPPFRKAPLGPPAGRLPLLGTSGLDNTEVVKEAFRQRLFVGVEKL
jgi:hypothetical protein